MDFIKPPGFGCKITIYPPGYSNPSPVTEYLYQQIAKEKEAACYEDIAAVIRRHYPGIRCTGAHVAARVNELLEIEERTQMAQNDDLISRRKALKDLRAIKDMLMAAGDPFLAGVMNRAIGCIENQPAVAAQEIRSEKHGNV